MSAIFLENDWQLVGERGIVSSRSHELTGERCQPCPKLQKQRRTREVRFRSKTLYRILLRSGQGLVARQWSRNLKSVLDNPFHRAAYIGARATLRATQRAHENNLLLQAQNQQVTIRGVVQAIYAELSCLWEIYQAEFGEEWDNFKSGEAFETYYPLNQDYFTVFNSTSVFMGQIKDDKLRTAIVKAYLRAKGLIDSHLLNNKLIEEHARLKNAMSLGTDLLQEQIVSDAFEHLKGYGVGIHSAYIDARTSVFEALRLMEQSGMIQTKTAILERQGKTEFTSL
jgi:hypothetical protein